MEEKSMCDLHFPLSSMPSRCIYSISVELLSTSEGIRLSGKEVTLGCEITLLSLPRNLHLEVVCFNTVYAFVDLVRCVTRLFVPLL